MSNKLMQSDYIIERFVPPSFSLKKLDLSALREATKKDWQLSSSGTASLINILKVFPAGSKVLAPAFICGSVVRAIKASGCEPLFYDIDPADLNGSVKSAEELSSHFEAKAIIAASLFGNPADLSGFEKLAKQKSLYLIDDSAQSFGAILDGKKIGTFGDAGLISFSPGKSTAGHMGSLYWSRERKSSPGRTNLLFSAIKYYDYYFNRLNVYRFRKYRRWLKPLSLLNTIISRSRFFFKMLPNEHDQMVMGGIIEAVQSQYSWRQEWVDKINALLKTKQILRPVVSLRGTAENFKVVIVCSSPAVKEKLATELNKNGIFFSSSYTPYLNEWTPETKELQGRVVELPVENDKTKMDLIYKVLSTAE